MGPDAVITPRRGEANWYEIGFPMRLSVVRRVDRVAWTTFVLDPVFGRSEDGGIGTAVAIGMIGHDGLPPDRRPAWPDSAQLDESLRSWIDRGPVEARSFVRDRLDLCDVLRDVQDVVRGELHVRNARGTYAARLVQALLIARDLDDRRREAEIVHVLDTAPRKGADPADTPLATLARRWAKDYSKVLGATVDW
jgi:hypothetical protein